MRAYSSAMVGREVTALFFAETETLTESPELPAETIILEITREELQRSCSRIVLSATPRPDKVPNRARKITIASRPDAFIQVYTECLKSGVFPTFWKRQRLALLLKPGKHPRRIVPPAAYVAHLSFVAANISFNKRAIGVLDANPSALSERVFWNYVLFRGLHERDKKLRLAYTVAEASDVDYARLSQNGSAARVARADTCSGPVDRGEKGKPASRARQMKTLPVHDSYTPRCCLTRASPAVATAAQLLIYISYVYGGYARKACLHEYIRGYFHGSKCFKRLKYTVKEGGGGLGDSSSAEYGVPNAYTRTERKRENERERKKESEKVSLCSRTTAWPQLVYRRCAAWQSEQPQHIRAAAHDHKIACAGVDLQTCRISSSSSSSARTHGRTKRNETYSRPGWCSGCAHYGSPRQRRVDRDRESTVYCAVCTRTAQKASVQLVLLDRVLWTLTIRLGSSGQRAYLASSETMCQLLPFSWSSNKQNKPPSLGLMGANRSEDRRAKTFDSRINSLLLLYYSMSACPSYTDAAVASTTIATCSAIRLDSRALNFLLKFKTITPRLSFFNNDTLGARFCRYELIQSLKRYIGNSAELFLTNTINAQSVSWRFAERKNVRGKRRGLAASCDAKRYKLYRKFTIRGIYARTCGDYLFYADSHDAPSSRRRCKRVYTGSSTLYSNTQARELSIFATLYTSLRFHSARYI
ncbi:unnamed protein product, partial [Trichogramma brassicae]